MDEMWLTTKDNPYDPFTQWDQWYAYDRRKGYYTCEYLARLAKTSDYLSDEMNDEIVKDTINEIVDLNVLGIYKIAYKNKEKRQPALV